MNKQVFTKIVLLVLVIALAGIIGYFAFVKKSEPITQQPIPTPKNETANWKTYSNTEFNYELRYPTNWQIFSKLINGPGTISKGAFLNNPSLLDPREPKDSLHSTHFSVRVYVDSTLKNVIAFTKGGEESIVTVTSQKYLGYNATVIDNYHRFEKSTAKWIVFQKDEKVFAVGYQYYPSFSEIGTLNQIYSTVKFTK